MDNEEVIASHAVEYYEWLAGKGGRDPEEILSGIPTERERALFLAAVDDINFLWGITASARSVRRTVAAEAASRN